MRRKIERLVTIKFMLSPFPQYEKGTSQTILTSNFSEDLEQIRERRFEKIRQTMICFNQILPPKNQGGDKFESFHSMRFESYHLMSPKVFPLLV